MDQPTVAHLDAIRITAGAHAAAADVRAAAARLTEWDIIPFTDELHAIDLRAPVLPEPVRSGVDEAECRACATPDADYLWTDEHWRVRPGNDRSVPIYLLEPRRHLDFGDLPDELGRVMVRLERAIGSVDGVGRVHVIRWGDGAAHLHIWFYARPAGMLQLRGMFLPVWTAILPPLPAGMLEAVNAAVARALSAEPAPIL